MPVCCCCGCCWYCWQFEDLSGPFPEDLGLTAAAARSPLELVAAAWGSACGASPDRTLSPRLCLKSPIEPSLPHLLADQVSTSSLRFAAEAAELTSSEAGNWGSCMRGYNKQT